MERKFLEDLGIGEENISAIIEESDKIKNEYLSVRNEYERLLGNVKNEKIENALKAYGAKNIDIVKSLINYDELSFDGINVEGVENQLEKIRAENDYLFENKDIPHVVSETEGTDNLRDTVRKAMGL